MRTYSKRINVRLTEEEYDILKEKADRAGVSIAVFFRRLVNEYRFPEKPDPDFVFALMNLSNIGDAIIEIIGTDTIDGFDEEQLKQDVSELEMIKEQLIKKYFGSWKT